MRAPAVVGLAALLMAVPVLCDEHMGTPKTFRSAEGRLPSPCTDPEFRSPVYSLGNVNISKRFQDNYYEDDKAVIQLNFTLRDTANDYGLRCVWGPLGRLDSSVPRWLSICVPEDAGVAIPDAFQTRTLIQVKTFAYRSTSPPNPISIAQLWMCSQENGSYPLVYQAAAELRLDASCPPVSDDNITYACNVTSPLPLTEAAEWTPPTLPSGPAQLVPRPDPPYVPPQGLNPPPEQDCTDMSLTHPDWTVEEAAYTNVTGGTDRLSLTLSSRTTRVKAACQSGTMTGVAPRIMKLSCSSPTTESTSSDPFRSQDTFAVEYTPDTNSVRIQHDWVCGDPRGTYRTEYRAAATVAMPLSCSGDTCMLDKPLIVQGQLLRPLKLTPSFPPPPPNANTPGCTAKSAAGMPSWEIKKFYFENTSTVQYIYGAITKPSLARAIQLELRNTANNYTESCSLQFAIQPEAGEPGWWRCLSSGRVADGRKEIVTLVKFDLTSGGVLSVDQTWYCNDTNPAKPTLFQANGTIKTTHCGWHNQTLRSNYCGPSASLEQCRKEITGRWCAFNNKWDPEAPNDLAPNPAPATITGTLVRTETLPEHELTDPDPKPGSFSCTASSVGRPVVWRLVQNRGPFLTTGWNSDKDLTDVRTKVTVSLENSALPPNTSRIFPLNGVGDWDSRMTPYLPNFAPGATRFVYIEQAGYYDGVVDWGVRFDPTNGYLELTHSWECLDKHPGWRTVFNGTWNGFLKLNCTFLPRDPDVPQFRQAGLACALADGDVTLMPRTMIEQGKAGPPDPK